MHIFFSGIGGTAIGPLAMIAKQASYDVSGSDKQNSDYIDYLKQKGLDSIHIGQSYAQIAAVHAKKPIDWFVYSSAVAIENAEAPELKFAAENGIKTSKRDELLNHIISDKKQKLIAIAGTHGKTTTTAMTVWLFKQLGIPVSYSVGAKVSFGEMGEFDPKSEYFVLEADEFDRNFLSYEPEISIISGIDYDHPDIYPTREDYNRAFLDFQDQSNFVFAHPADLEKIGLVGEPESVAIDSLKLVGQVNRQNAQLVVEAMHFISKRPVAELTELMNQFPGLSRRFEKIADGIYSDYAHTPAKIRGALQTAREVSDSVVVVYEGLHNTRQHFIKDELPDLFTGVKKLYIVPSYRAREDQNLEDLTPQKLTALIKDPTSVEPAELNQDLETAIQNHAQSGDLVLCLTAGGGRSLDEWLRQTFTSV